MDDLSNYTFNFYVKEHMILSKCKDNQIHKSKVKELPYSTILQYPLELTSSDVAIILP